MVRLDATFQISDSLTPEIAAKISQHASRYDAQVQLECGGKRLRLDSLIGILSVELVRGNKLTVLAEGAQEQEAAADIKKLIADI